MSDTLAPVTTLATREAYDAAVSAAVAAAAAYYETDEITMDDAAYDALVRGISAAEQAHPDWKSSGGLTDQVAAGVSAGGDVMHTVPMLSLDNVFSADELDAWAAGLAKRLGRTVNGFTVEPKMDGLALSARYRAGELVQLVTRGDGTSGEDVTFVARHIVGLPQTLTAPVDIEARGEVLLTDEQFERANELRLANGDKPFVNPRNGAAGALRGAKDRQYSIPLTFFGYGAVSLGMPTPAGQQIADLSHSDAMYYLESLGIQTTWMSTAGNGQCATWADVHRYIDSLAERRPDLGFAIDGAVIKADSSTDRSAAGFSSKAPRWGIARKYPADSAIATLEEVIWQVGRTGVITPRARITPTYVGGTTITYATLHNPADMTRKGFMLHDRVSVHRAGEVIPRLEAPVMNLRDGSQTPIDIPTVCPRCGSGIDKSQERWRCVRGRYCGLAESVRYAAARDAWDIEGMGDKIVDQLVSRELIVDVSQLFTLTKAQLLTLDRMGELTADKLLEQIQGAKAQPLSRTITALGIRGTGRSMSRRLAKHFGSMDALRAATAEQLAQVDGIGEEKAPVIVAELTELAAVIDELAASGLTMTEPGTAAAGDAPEAGALPLAGKVVVVSGAMSGPLAALSRNEMNELIERAGGKSSGSVSKKTSYLVTTETGTSKAVKASELGVPVLTPEQFADLVASLL